MVRAEEPKKQGFTVYQIFVIIILAILQFTVVLDFMVLSPLGAILLVELNIQPAQFGWVVSAYAFSAGASGLLAAGFADKFDRKKLLLFFYFGFVIATILCAIAPTYEFLLAARIITGIFGGVISSVTFAIITDLFNLERRGRVMGFVQMSFAASQILGLPIGLILANRFGWHSPFWMIAGFGSLIWLAIAAYMKPITAHLNGSTEQSAFQHLLSTLFKKIYLRAFLATVFLATGGFMLMPFGSAFSINNLHVSLEQLPILYLVTGLSTIFLGPILGMMSDKFGKYRLFASGSVLTIIMVVVYTNLDISPFWIVVLVNVFLFAGITSRMISGSALMTAVPEQHDRGAFMSINSSVQQISGGIAAGVAGAIVVQNDSGTLANYDILGYLVVSSVLITIGLMFILNKRLKNRAINSKVD
jgi:predicted MFS family arabinose efflux permease